MNVIFFCIHLPFVCSELHTFVATYAEIRDLTFFAATTLNGQQIGYFDNDQKKLVPKQDWMKRIESKTQRKEDTVIKDNVQKIYINNIHELIEQLHESQGVHTYQGRHGCSWEDQTDYQHEFHYYAYDEEDFITLDMMKNKYSASVPQAIPIVEKWNNDGEQTETLKEYYDKWCINRLKKFLTLTKIAFKGTVPKVSLLQKRLYADVKCHVTGFYSKNIVILWRKNGQDLNDPALMEFGEILPNNDGTFQRTVTLRVSPHDWKKELYTCVVEHMGKTIQSDLIKANIKRNYSHITLTASNSSTSALQCIGCQVVFALLLWCIVIQPTINNQNGGISGEPHDSKDCSNDIEIHRTEKLPKLRFTM